jgi:hypothetical protein
MKTGICQICHKDFKITKKEKLYLHGYKRELKQKTWKGIVTFTKRYYKIISPACKGSGLLASKIKGE